MVAKNVRILCHRYKTVPVSSICVLYVWNHRTLWAAKWRRTIKNRKEDVREVDTMVPLFCFFFFLICF